MSDQVTDELLATVRELPKAEQRRVLDFASFQNRARPQGS